MRYLFLILLLASGCATATKRVPDWYCECLQDGKNPELPCGCGDIPAPAKQ